MSLERLQKIDSRWIWLVFLLGIVIPLIRPMGLPIMISDNTRKVYETINGVPDGSIVFYGPDFSFGNRGEVQPMMEAILKHLFSKNVKVISACFYTTDSPIMLEEAVKTVGLEAYGKKYGVDFVNLGFLAGRESTVVAFGTDTHALVTVDYYGTPISKLPIMESIHSAKDIGLVVCITGGEIFPEVYLRQWQTKYGTKVTGGAVAMIYPMMMSYIASDQLSGFLASSRGAAEYELLTKNPGKAILTMDAQSLGHLITIAAIVICNIGYLASIQKQKKGGAKA